MIAFSRQMLVLPTALPGFEQVPRHWDATMQSWVAQVVSSSYYVTEREEVITTVLGSCVATCVRDPERRVGGMNHFMLPHDPGDEEDGDAMRFGSYAVERLLNDVVKHGGRRERLEAKIFGGGRVIQNRVDIGGSNVAFVTDYLRAEQIPIASADVGGPCARRLRYYPATGRAQVRYLDTPERRRVVADEEQLERRLRTSMHRNGEIELF